MGLTAGLALCLGPASGCEMTSDGDQANPDAGPAPKPEVYAVGGRAGGVPKRVVLRLEFEGGSELLAVTRDGSFWFDTLLPQGAWYDVVLVDAPSCLLDRATGTLADANVEMALSCQGAAALSELAVFGPAAPALAFSPGQIAYTIDVPVLQQSIVLSPVAMRDEDIITVAGQPVTSGTPSAPLALDLGDNHIEVAVYYPRGELSLTRTYHVNVRRAVAVAQYAHGEGSNTYLNDSFGWRVALSGDTLAVSARGEDSGAVGVDGDQDDNSALDSGAVYVFRRSGTSWQQEAYVKALNTDEYDRFGEGLALSGDTLAVGAPDEDSSAGGGGAVYVYRRSGGMWSHEAYLEAPDAGAVGGFGASLALSGDMLAVGAPGESSSAMGVGGDQADDSAPGSGAVYVFQRSGSAWSQEAYIKASNTEEGDDFGVSVALSGDTLAVGAPGEDSSAMGVGGDQTDDGAEGSGAVYVFQRSNASWSQEAYVKASNTGAGDKLGRSVALSGDTLAVGAPGEDSGGVGVNGDQSGDGSRDNGAVYVFQRSNASWSQEAYVKAFNTATDDYFGTSVALSGDTLAVGATGEDGRTSGVGDYEDNDGMPESGAVYVFH